MQGDHCQQGMVFAINPPPTGDKTFSNYKQNAMGATSTVVATATTATTVTSAAPPASVATSVDDGQCNCVCNVDINNGYSSTCSILTTVPLTLFKVLVNLVVLLVKLKVWRSSLQN